MSLVANVRHLSTGHVSPQFHVVFDDLIETMIRNGDNDVVVNSICNGSFDWNRKLYVEDELDADDVSIYKPPPLHEVWLNETGRCQGKEDLLPQRHMKTLCMHIIGKLESKLVQLLDCPVLSRILFPTVPPSLMMIVWFFQFAVNIQNPRESLGMIIWIVLSTFLTLLLNQIYKMRELAQISFLREILRSMLLRELQYHLHPI